MIEIPLTQGKVARISDAGYGLVAGHKWYARKSRHTYYALTNIRDANGKRKSVSMHRLLSGLGFSDPRKVDHWDLDGLNNQFENLRIVTNGQNQHNARPRINTTSKFKGVYWHRQARKWRAQIRFNGKRYHLGYFPGEEMAARAYDEAALRHHGEFARPNALDRVEAKR